MQKGFTLIELLVVVLIIGILSSIALPQYTRAVDRARGTEALTNMKSLADAQNIYYLNNTSYTSDTSRLDIQLSEMKNFSLGSISLGGTSSVTLRIPSKTKDATLIYVLRSGKFDNRYCTGSDCKNFFGVGSGIEF